MRLPIPKALEERLAPLRERGERFLRNWEWTWTSAVLASFAIAFIAYITLAAVPSWFLYFADQELRWTSFWLLKLRDLLVAGWIGTWFAIMLVTAYIIQNIRRRLRGQGGDTRPTGGYR